MIAKLHIHTGRRSAKTFLKQCYFTTPFKIANITEDKNSDCLQLMLMSSSPGVLDGDEYDIKIEVVENSSLQLHTQSYQRLFTMKDGASQRMEIRLQPGASFCFLPHPIVPHQSSRFIATNKIYLSDGCSLTWGEVLTCGRKLSGEAFVFSKYRSLTEIFINNKLAVKENLLITPAATNVHAIGQYENYSHQASLIIIDDRMAVDHTIGDVHEMLSMVDGVCYGISVLPVNGIIIRMLGHKGEQLHSCLKSIAGIVTVKENKEVAHAG